MKGTEWRKISRSLMLMFAAVCYAQFPSEADINYHLAAADLNASSGEVSSRASNGERSARRACRTNRALGVGYGA